MSLPFGKGGAAVKTELGCRHLGLSMALVTAYANPYSETCILGLVSDRKKEAVFLPPKCGCFA